MQEDTENRQDNGVSDEAPGQEAAEQEPVQEAAEETAAEEAPVAEAPAAEGAEESAEAEAPAPPAAEAEAAEPVEQLSSKERRKQARSRASGPAGPERSPEDRARERTETRARKGAARARWRTKRREKDRAARTSAPAAPQEAAAAYEPGKRKMRQGIVVSSKGDKTITVRTDAVRRHRVYGKVIRETNTLHAHDETNQAGEGDIVRVVECRPLSRTKRWRLVDVLEKAR